MKTQNSYYKSNSRTSWKLYRLHLKTNQIYTSYGLTNFPSMSIEVPCFFEHYLYIISKCCRCDL